MWIKTDDNNYLNPYHVQAICYENGKTVAIMNGKYINICAGDRRSEIIRGGNDYGRKTYESR